MNFAKVMFYTICGSLLVLFYRDGHQVLMNWTFVIWIFAAAWDLAKTLTPYKKASSRWHD